MDYYEEYLIAKAEAKACGQEFPSYEEWLGKHDLKEDAMENWKSIYDKDEQDLY